MMPRGWTSSPPPAISMEEAVRIAARAARAARPGIRDIRPSASFRDGRWFVAMTYTEDLDPFGVLMVEGGCTVIVDESGTVVGRRSGAHSR